MEEGISQQAGREFEGNRTRASRPPDMRRYRLPPRKSEAPTSNFGAPSSDCEAQTLGDRKGRSSGAPLGILSASSAATSTDSQRQFVYRSSAPPSTKSTEHPRQRCPSLILVTGLGKPTGARPRSSQSDTNPKQPRTSSPSGNPFIYRPPAAPSTAAAGPSCVSRRTTSQNNRFIYRPPGAPSARSSDESPSCAELPLLSTLEVRKAKMRCKRCGSKSHLWKECPDDRSCARCSDADSRKPCQTVSIRTRMMKDCRDKGNLTELRNLLVSLKIDGHKPTVHAYSLLLSLLVSRGQMQEAQKVFEAMQEEDDMVADTICYNTLLNGWCSAGKLEEAKALLYQMKERQCKLTTSTYNTLIKGFGLAGQTSEAMKLVQQMTAEGGVAKPNKQTYNILINAWAKMKDVKQARWVLDLMRHAGFSPDVVTFNTVAKAYCELRRCWEAERVLEEMQNAFIRPNERTYGIIINGYCEAGRPEDGLALLERMKMDLVRCNLAIYNILIKGFAEQFQFENVDKVIDLMETSGVKPDVQSFSLVMNVWCSSRLIEEAQDIFYKMQRVHKLRPDVMAYTILAKGYVRARRPAEAEGLLSEMGSQGLKPNVFTYTTVISGWCSVGNMEDALRVFKNMQINGVAPNSHTISTLIWGFSENKEPNKAEEVLASMKKMGISPDRKCLELVAEAWRSVGLPAEARRVLQGERVLYGSDNPLKISFDSMIAGRETVLDSNIYRKLNLEPESAVASGRLTYVTINSVTASRTPRRRVMGALPLTYRTNYYSLDRRNIFSYLNVCSSIVDKPHCKTSTPFRDPRFQCRVSCRLDHRMRFFSSAGTFSARSPLLHC